MRRLRIVGETLRRCRGCQDHAERENGSAGGQAPPMAAHAGAPPERRRSSLAGGDYGHYPSSWYNKAKNPVRPPTHTGSHAEAIGCINSALLKSSVTFDKT